RPTLDDAPVGTTAAIDCAIETRGIGEHELLPLADQPPGEVLGLAVEEGTVILREIGTEKAVGAVGGRYLPDALEGWDVGPGLIVLGRVAKAPAERCRTVQIRRRGDGRALLGGEVQLVGGWCAIGRRALVVQGPTLEDRLPLEPVRPKPI